jgi:hypothetical protein
MVSNRSPFSFHLINSIAIRAAAQTPVQMEFLGGTRFNASNISTPVAPQEGASHLERQKSGSAR